MGLLGNTRRKVILELGCGAARWSIALARGGARPTGLDLSSVQLAKARELQRESHVRFPLVRASAERLPFRDAVFDLIFCDWGAMTFADPMRSVPECARVLRRGGGFVFATASPLRYLTLDLAKDRQSRRLIRPYFGSHRVDLGSDEAIEFQLPYGAWVDLFRKNGLRVERLVETRPTPRRRFDVPRPGRFRLGPVLAARDDLETAQGMNGLWDRTRGRTQFVVPRDGEERREHASL